MLKSFNIATNTKNAIHDMTAYTIKLNIEIIFSF